jgi:hypothetical protein
MVSSLLVIGKVGAECILTNGRENNGRENNGQENNGQENNRQENNGQENNGLENRQENGQENGQENENRQENKLKGKSIIQKVYLVAKYVPVVALTALFRLGGSAISLYSTSNFHSITPISAVFYTWVSYCLLIPLTLGVMYALRLWSLVLRRLTATELVQGILGECTTVTVWGSLGREGRLAGTRLTNYFW